jgi:hypothetical protein
VIGEDAVANVPSETLNVNIYVPAALNMTWSAAALASPLSENTGAAAPGGEMIDKE